MKTMISKLIDAAIIYDKTLLLFKPLDAIKLIDECKKLDRKIYGIDAFVMNRDQIQPFLEHSVDYSNDEKEITWENAIDHIKKYIDSKFIFEVVYEATKEETKRNEKLIKEKIKSIPTEI